MTHPGPGGEGVAAALDPLARTLAADGYRLEVTRLEAAARRLVLTIAAGEGACAECLVPEELLCRLARERLSAAIPGAPWNVEFVLPGTAPVDA
ncbi:hypothetical protein [Streptomyces sp. CB03238]|uniref:hypothetical protein n=1 Tax=Streptomyces sp. CB03238 TaxID=1907777 RepID=UPI000A11C2DB|nr:hypothetical protein [Streptomyces sp. CB03238]ORT57573.1 hypothetical protein BKD26_23340 [Streptomyces sp. CB03238]